MSKNTNDLAAEQAALNAEIAALQEKQSQALAKLRDKQNKIAEKAKEQEQKRLAALGETVDGLPEMLGVATLEDVLRLVRQRIKGTLGSLVKTETVGRSYTVLTQTQEDEIAALLKAGGPAGQLSVLAKQFNVSIPTIFKRKVALGLVQSRKGEAVNEAAAAPAAEPVAAS